MPRAGQPQEGFMHQGGGLQRLGAIFPPQVRGGQFLQFVVDERNHGVQGLPIPGVNPLQQFRDFHGRLS
jgi:hypothetical protein